MFDRCDSSDTTLTRSNDSGSAPSHAPLADISSCGGFTSPIDRLVYFSSGTRAQVPHSSCVCAVGADLHPLQAAISFRPISSHCMLRSFHNPCRLIFLFLMPFPSLWRSVSPLVPLNSSDSSIWLSSPLVSRWWVRLAQVQRPRRD